MGIVDSFREKMTIPRWRNAAYGVGLACMATLIAPFVTTPKTNRAYLHQLIETNTMDKTAKRLMDIQRQKRMYPEEDLARGEALIAERLNNFARAYELTSDPYLDQKADSESGRILAGKIMKAAGIVEPF